MNSRGSAMSFCHSIIWPSQARSASSCAFLPAPSLYRQCAAMPYSAVRCISRVRIWISSGLPSGPTTVVCSDWYMLNLGIAM